jgi:putative SOS response-associated peptidase YedK
MVMTDSAGTDAAQVHERMPVLLAPEDQSQWLSGSPQDALALCRAWPGALAIDRTDQPWAKGAAHQPGLL